MNNVCVVLNLHFSLEKGSNSVFTAPVKLNRIKRFITACQTHFYYTCHCYNYPLLLDVTCGNYYVSVATTISLYKIYHKS